MDREQQGREGEEQEQGQEPGPTFRELHNSSGVVSHPQTDSSYGYSSYNSQDVTLPQGYTSWYHEQPTYHINIDPYTHQPSRPFPSAYLFGSSADISPIPTGLRVQEDPALSRPSISRDGQGIPKHSAPVQCRYCGRDDLTRIHARGNTQATVDMPQICGSCIEIFTLQTPSSPRKQVAPSVICGNCDKVLNGPYASGNLARHNKSKACAASKNRKAFLCDFEGCARQYERSDALLDHKRKKHTAPGPRQVRHISTPDYSSSSGAAHDWDVAPVVGGVHASFPERHHQELESALKIKSHSSPIQESKAESEEDGSTNTSFITSSDDRLLNPNAYLNGVKRLRGEVIRNSALGDYWSEQRASSNPKAPEYTAHHGFPASVRWATDSKESAEDFDLCRRKSSFDLFDLLECRNLMRRICTNLHHLRNAGFCDIFFSIVVMDPSNPTVAHLLPVPIAEVEKLKQLFENRCSQPEDSSSKPPELTAHCLKLLVDLKLNLLISEQSWIWRTTVHLLDFAIMSYVGAHTEHIGDASLDSPATSFNIPGPFAPRIGTDLKQATPLEDHNAARKSACITIHRRKLRCLDQFLGRLPVWVFRIGASELTDDRLYLSTDVATLADIWGPVWKRKRGPDSTEVSWYDIGNGFIVPWNGDNETDTNFPVSNEEELGVFCHWIHSREWDETYVELHQTKLPRKHFLENDRLFIGGCAKNRLVVNEECAMTLKRKLQIKQELKNADNLKYRGTRCPRREKGSQSFLVQASAAGFATLGTTVEYKRNEGLNLKDVLMQRWRNGSRNLQYLEMWGGVEVSLCTGNARRRQLLHLLGTLGMRRYLSTISFDWLDGGCEDTYYEACRDTHSLREVWKAHPEWWKNIGDAIYECLLVLEETGVDERDDSLRVLWIENFEEEEESDSGCGFVTAEEHLITMRRSEHTWTGLLRDSPESLTMVIAEDNCLDFNDGVGYGIRCQKSRYSRNEKEAGRHNLGYSVLQTAILVNDDLLDEVCLAYHQISGCSRRHDEGLNDNAQSRRHGDARRKPIPHSVEFEDSLQHIFGENSRRWKGYWNVSQLKDCSKFNFGTHGYLSVVPELNLAYPVVLEWEPLLTLGKELKIDIKEKMLGKSGDNHHSEYLSGVFLRPPLPCLVLSKKKGEKKKSIRY